MRSPLSLWAIGAVSLIVATVSTLIAGAIVAIPLSLALAALGYSQEWVFSILLWTAVVWLPLGFGAGMGTVAKFVKGYKSTDPRGN